MAILLRTKMPQTRPQYCLSVQQSHLVFLRDISHHGIMRSVILSYSRVISVTIQSSPSYLSVQEVLKGSKYLPVLLLYIIL